MNALPRIWRSNFHFAWLLLLLPPLLRFLATGDRDPVAAGVLLLFQITPLLALIVFLAGSFRHDDAPYFHRLANEFRAQLPGASVAIGIAGLLFAFQDRETNTWAFAIYVIGCAMMGATSLGAEFEQKTVGGLLAQPFRRGRIYGEKMLVLGCLLGLAMVEAFLGRFAMPAGDGGDGWPLFAAPVLAFCSGPLLSLRTRGTLPGAVLSVGAPMLLIGLGHVILPLFRHLRSPLEQPADTTDGLSAWTVVVLSIYAALCAWRGWRGFLQLELKEATQPGAEFNPFAGAIDRIVRRLLPDRLAPGSSMLWRKEFRLHVVPWMISALMVGTWILLLAGRRLSESIRFGSAVSYEEGFVFLAVVFGGITLLLAGAASVAEERQMGVLDWQLTTPAPVLRQWWIKVGATFLIAVALGIVLPAMLLTIALGGGWLAGMIAGQEWQMLAYVDAGLLILAMAMYGSSLSRSTVKAACATIAISLVTFAVGAVILGVTAELLRMRDSELRELRSGIQPQPQMSLPPLTPMALLKWYTILLPPPVLVVWLVAAGRNFRFGPPKKADVVRQFGLIALVILAIIGIFVVGAAIRIEWIARSLFQAPTA